MHMVDICWASLLFLHRKCKLTRCLWQMKCLLKRFSHELSVQHRNCWKSSWDSFFLRNSLIRTYEHTMDQVSVHKLEVTAFFSIWNIPFVRYIGLVILRFHLLLFSRSTNNIRIYVSETGCIVDEKNWLKNRWNDKKKNNNISNKREKSRHIKFEIGFSLSSYFKKIYGRISFFLSHYLVHCSTILFERMVHMCATFLLCCSAACFSRLMMLF